MLQAVKNFFAEFFSEPERDSSAAAAKKRLKLVLIHDRIKLAPEELESMKFDLIEVISKYVEIDEEQLDLFLSQKSNDTSLVVNIPVLTRKQAYSTSSDADFDEREVEQKEGGKSSGGRKIAPAKRKQSGSTSTRTASRSSRTTRSSTKGRGTRKAQSSQEDSE